MKFIKSNSLLMIFALILGIGIFGTAQTVNAQQSKSKMEKKQKKEDENDGEDTDDGNTSQNKNVLEKTAGGIKHTTAKVFHKII